MRTPAPGGAPAPQQSMPQPQGPQQGGPQPASPAGQFLKMIEAGFKGIGQVIQSAGQQAPPDLMKAFQIAAQATEQFLELVEAPQGQSQQAQGQPPGRNGPMPMNANAGAQPMAPGSQ